MKHLNYLKQLLLPVLLLLSAAATAVPLNGTYTVYGAGASYTDLAAAITALNGNGVSGPVVFNIRAGSYSGTTAQGVVNQITGASSTNTVTFQAESGPGTTTLNPSATGYSTNFIFGLNNAQWIIIKDLTLSNTAISTTYGTDVDFIGSASNNIVTNCVLTGNTATGTSTYKSRILAYWASMPSATSGTAGFTGSNNKVLNCQFPAGTSYGVYLYGNTGAATHANGFEISGCNMTPFIGAIYANYFNNLKFNNNIVTRNTASTGTWYGFYFYDCDSSMQVMGNTQTAGTPNSTVYLLYRYGCDGRAGMRQIVANNIISLAGNSTTTYPVYYYQSQYDSTVGNNITATTSSTLYHYAYYNDYHTFMNNTINYTNGNGYMYWYNMYSVTTATISPGRVCTGNTINLTNTGSGYYVYNYMLYYADGGKFNNNTLTVNTTNGSSIYDYIGYYCNNSSVNGNTINVTANTSGTVYGIYAATYANTIGNNVVSNNKIVATVNTSGTVYGLMYYYGNNDKVFNNAVTVKGNTPTTAIPSYIGYLYGPLSVYNNTYNDQTGGTGTKYTLYCYYSYGGTATFNNNIFYRKNTGSASSYYMYMYDYPNTSNTTLGQYYQFDYNMHYTPNQTTNFLYNVYWGTATYATYQQWKANSYNKQDKNSVFLQPAFINGAAGDVTPDPSNTDCWPMNGRGIHIAGNNADINGNPRHTITSTGVPDLGAYEFTPNSGVTAPLCQVTPATPVPGGTQTYTLGYDTVATITWDASATVPATAPTCQQYSGATPIGLTSLNPTNMYFYTDILSGTNANYTANVYYKDPWIGTIATEQALHLAKKDGANPWVGYALPGSAANSTRNFIYSPSSPMLNTYGSYTGIDVPNNAGVIAVVEPSGAFCPGTFNVKVKIRNGGNNVINSVKIDWIRDLVPQPQINYTTPIPVNNGTPGINEVVIDLGPSTFMVAARSFKVWTSLPNGQTDPIPADDTLSFQLRAALNGDYTVGGTTPDFPDLVTAVGALKSSGMCGSVRFLLRTGTYTGNVDLTSVAGSSVANRFTITNDAATGASASTINVNYSTTGASDNYVIRFNGLANVTISNITVNNTGVAGQGAAIAFVGTSANDSIKGCNLNAYNATTSTSYYGIYVASATTPNLKIINNNVSACVGMYLYSGTTNTPGLEVIKNNILAYYLGIYQVYYFNGPKVNYNVVNTPITTGGYYGIYYIYCSGNTLPMECIGNKVYNCQYGTYYIAYAGNSSTQRSYITNNLVVYNGTGTCYYGLYAPYCNRTTYAHNTVSLGGTSYAYGYAAYLYQSTYTADSSYNNVFANYAGGYGVYSYMYPGYQHSSDYNNIYTTGTVLVYDGYSGSFANMGTWRTSTAAVNALNADANSISYEPGLDKATGMPDPTNAKAWSIHGRGKQNGIVTVDINGTPRPTTLGAGVPDLGAFEFDPPSVAPPNAVPTPTVPAPGVTQTFDFGYTRVATVRWNTQLALTSALNVKPYSGVMPPYNFAVPSQGKYPYFYTDIAPQSSGSTFDFNLNVNYYDTWLGKIPNETNMKLAHKFTSVPWWVSYNSANSSSISNASQASQSIYAAGVTGFGAFTGIDDNVNFSANVTVVGSTVLCTGKTVTLNASPVSGGSTTYTYQWKKNSIDIAGATGASYIATTGGDYSVVITATSVTPNISAESAPVAIIVVSPPMALISANGPLTYCVGSGLTLSASSGGTTYKWLFNGSPAGTSATQPVLGAGVYAVIVSNIGCSDTSDNTIVNAGPIAVNLGSDIKGCEIKGVPYILDAGYPGAKYLWSTGDTTQTIKVFKGSGTYSVSVDAGPNCTGSDNVSVALDPLPSINGISYLRTGNTYVFSASGAKNVTGYFWMFSDGTTSIAPSVTKIFDGSMTAKLVVKNDCGNDTINMVNWSTGVSNTTAAELEANVYPNPANNVVTFAVKGATMKDVTILNAVGEVVYRAEMGGAATEATINVSTFASGRYIVRSSTSEGIISKPFNVQR